MRTEHIQSTLGISNSKRLSEILRDIRTSTFNKYMCNGSLEVRDILKILWKRGESNFHNIFYLLLDFHI